MVEGLEKGGGPEVVVVQSQGVLAKGWWNGANQALKGVGTATTS